MLSINTNLSALWARNILNITNKNLEKSMQRLYKGQRINSASDDPSGYYISQGLNSKIRGLKQAQNNIAMGTSLLNTSEDTLGTIINRLNRLNELALESSSNNIAISSRESFIKEANTIVDEIKKLNNETFFNGLNIFGETGNFSQVLKNPDLNFAAVSQNTQATSVSAFSTPPEGSKPAL